MPPASSSRLEHSAFAPAFDTYLHSRRSGNNRKLRMRFLSGVICGVLLTILATFIADSATTPDQPSQRIVNWDIGEQIIGHD